MTRVIHTGDTHIGYQQYHSPERRQDFLDAFEQVVDDAIEMDVAAVIHAGDLFHDRRPELPDLLGTLSGLRALADAGIPFLAVVGNHESTRGGQWLDLFERMELATRLGSQPVMVDDVAVYGLDHVPNSRRDDLEYTFRPPGDDATHTALVSHGLFSPFAHGNWETETILDESNVAFDAMLVGDNHAAQTEQVDETWITYCGSTERASASEQDGRGYNVVEFDSDSPGPAGVDIRQRSLNTREFVFVSVELSATEGARRVREALGAYDLDDAVVIVEITGDGEPVMPASIEEFALDRGALVARVTDRREIDSETELSVSFADPDAAVDEKIREMALSKTAIDIDETVRASKIADSNVRTQVKQVVDETVNEDNPEGADSTPNEDEPGTETAADVDGHSDDGQLTMEDLQ